MKQEKNKTIYCLVERRRETRSRLLKYARQMVMQLKVGKIFFQYARIQQQQADK